MTETNSTEISQNGGVIEYLPILTSAVALIFSVIGLVRVANIYRQIIYAGQALICIYLLVNICLHLKKGGIGYLKVALYAYAVIEALRATILVTIGIIPLVGYDARFILILLACSCVLTAERLGRPGQEIAALSIVILEVVLYLVFLLGFPGVIHGRLNRFYPIVGVLIGLTFFILIRKGKAETSGSNDAAPSSNQQ
ncbi:MAG: hypothetical protein K6E91_09775 [Butyrivibrio sp.]|nr:hypothetical protein [Butyrivibrio sp.]